MKRFSIALAAGVAVSTMSAPVRGECWRTPTPQTLEEVGSVLKNKQARNASIRNPSATRQPVVFAFSNGGLKAAYGAGLLVGWGETGRRPGHASVTAVGMSALIAPFAFLGPEGDQKVADIFTCESDSFVDMAHRAASYIDPITLEKIARKHEDGARLLVALPGSAARRESVWDIGAIAASRHPNAQRYIENILLAAVDLTTFIDPATIPIPAGALVGRNLTFRQVGAGEPFLFPGTTSKHVANYLFHNGVLFPDESEAYMAKRRDNPSVMAHLATAPVVSGYDFFLAVGEPDADIRIASIRPQLNIQPQSGFDMAYLRALFLHAYRQGRMSREWRKTFHDRDTSRRY